MLLVLRLWLLAQRTSAESTSQVHVAAQRWQAALETASAYHLDCDAVYRQVPHLKVCGVAQPGATHGKELTGPCVVWHLSDDWHTEARLLQDGS